MRLMSASIAATAVIDCGARRNQSSHGGGETRYPLACFESLIDEGGGERARKSDAEAFYQWNPQGVVDRRPASNPSLTGATPSLRSAREGRRPACRVGAQ